MKRIEFIMWAGKQGWKYGQKYLNKAYNHFYDKGMLPDPKTILQKAKNYMSPRFLADKKRSAKIIPKEWNKFKPEIVKPIKVPEQTKNILNIKSTLKGRPVKVVPEPKVGDAMKVFEERVIGPAKVIYGRFPKKPPRKPKADGGSIDKALSGRSRDI